ncbi:hypothetical protein [Pantoea sp. App145]|uniref:hypothetical protein n=1 Tax=Pantoea sp. App145 TaxID=3071567 RepID=UPI003A7F7CBE
MKKFYFTRLLRGMLLISLTLGVYGGGAAGAADYSIYNADNKTVLAAYINEDVYIIGNQYYDAGSYEGAVTPVLPIEIKGYTSREPGKYTAEGKISRASMDVYSVSSDLTKSIEGSMGPSWLGYFLQTGTNNGFDFDNGSHPRKAGLALRLHIDEPRTWLNGYWDYGDYLYGDPDPQGFKNYVQVGNNTWQIRAPGTIQFFRYGELSAINGSDHKPVPFPVDISPEMGMFRIGSVFIEYFAYNNTMTRGGPEEKAVNGSVYLIANIHFVSRKTTVKITGNEISTHSDAITSRDSDPPGTSLGDPIPATLSFPFTSTDPIASLRLSNSSDSLKIKGIRVFTTNVPGIGYQITDKDGKELSPTSARVQGGNLTVPVNLTFIKTGEIMSGSKVSKLNNMGKLMVITGKDINDRVLYDSQAPLTYDGNAKIIVPALGCD